MPPQPQRSRLSETKNPQKPSRTQIVKTQAGRKLDRQGRSKAGGPTVLPFFRFTCKEYNSSQKTNAKQSSDNCDG
jgi:hypothetical protein